MRSLVVTRWSPWPPTSGARHRSANVISALAELGEVDVFLLADPGLESELAPPGGLNIGQTGAVTRSSAHVGRWQRLRPLLPGGEPTAVASLRHEPARTAFSSWVQGTYDLAWFVRIESWLALGDLVPAPAVIDYDDLRDHLARSRLASAWPDPASPSPVRTIARRGGWVLRTADARAWRRLQAGVARSVDAVVVCSDLDRRRLGVPNAHVVPNGVDLPARPVGRRVLGSPPVLCLHGSLTYGPNVDAAVVLVRDVLPRVRRALPDVEVRLVGRNDDRVARLAGHASVEVTGPVVDIVDELARVDVVTVPLRQGAGTRIKVLEAFAQRLPVVATSIAVEGLDVTSEEHLLVADEPEAFAGACVRVLTDPDLRARLVDAAEALVRQRYGWQHGRAAAARLAASVASASSS